MTKKNAKLGSAGHLMQIPDAGYERVGPLVSITSLLREHGQDPEPILVRCGLDPALLSDPENTISFEALGRLAAECGRATGVPHFGLLVGQRSGIETLGPLNDLARNAPDVGSALVSILRHLPVHDRASIPTLHTDNGLATLIYAAYLPAAEGFDHICDGSIALICNIIRFLCGADWTPSEVVFSHSRPADLTPYRRFFRAPLRFDMEHTAVVFPRHWLQRRLPDSDAILHHSLEARLAAMLPRGNDDVVDELRRTLGTELGLGNFSVERVAQLLSLHRRTLHRRLKDQGTTFRILADELRFEYAKQLLRYTKLPVIDIATALDYAHASAFTRAFRRWSGTTPAAWRARDCGLQ